jgi:DNA repair exonuclease SbcCD ATPase subunit
VLTYKKLSWGNCFSYGDKNIINLDSAPITQLIGKNGHGKSSIALILEEVLYNKNSKNIKKGNILNRYVKDKQYWIDLEFDKDGVEYRVHTVRGSTQKVELYRGEENISSHTATATYKEIESIIGYDHKTFSQIVYQSSTQSLEFLTATDTQRKKFLIDLLNLGQYTTALEVFKAELATVNKQSAVIEGKISQAESWVAKYGKENLVKQELVDVPDYPAHLDDSLKELQAMALNISKENAQRVKNAEYKRMLDSVKILPAPTEKITQQEIDGLRNQSSMLMGEFTAINKNIAKLQGVKDKCPTCGAKLAVDGEHIQQEIALEREKQVRIKTEVDSISAQLTVALDIQKRSKLAEESSAEYEKYYSLYDSSIPIETVDVADIEQQIKTVKAELDSGAKAITAATAKNQTILRENARVDLILGQRAEMEEELKIQRKLLVEVQKRIANLTVLVKAFSTTGLVAYKIECLVKDLEDLTNVYLTDMSDGRFQLGFEVNSSDKLNVVITDNGTDIDIAALSTGERARVNIATLLAIRKLMQSLSSTKTNLLILDETVENLDSEGKEKLIEILVNEPDLNTFLISHGFSHPLLEKLHVVKTKNISRISSD